MTKRVKPVPRGFHKEDLTAEEIRKRATALFAQMAKRPA